MIAEPPWGKTRPWPIVWFERVVLASLAISSLSVIDFWSGASDIEADAAILGNGMLIGTMVGYFAAMLLLLWFITRRASQVGAWIYVALSVGSILMQLAIYEALLALEPESLASSLVQLAFTVVSLVLLGQKQSRDWLAGKVDPQYDQVFD